jgi:hypothetical protein
MGMSLQDLAIFVLGAIAGATTMIWIGYEILYKEKK